MNEVIGAKLGEIGRLCATYRVARLELFSSATRYNFDPASSDLDFLVSEESVSSAEHRVVPDLVVCSLKPKRVYGINSSWSTSTRGGGVSMGIRARQRAIPWESHDA